MNKKLTRLLAAALTCLVLLGAMPASSFADEYDQELEEVNQKKEEASNNRKAAQQKLDDLKEQQADLIEEKMALEERNIAAQEEITAINEEIAIYNLKIAAKEQDVMAAAQLEQAQLERYRVRVRAMEESGGYNILTILFNSESLADMIAAIDDYREVMNSDLKLYDELQAARQVHQQAEEEFIALKENCEARKDTLEAEKAELEQQIAGAEAEIEALGEEIAKAEEELIAMERAEAAASASVTNFLAEYYRQKAAAAAAAQAAAQQNSQNNQNTGSNGEGGADAEPAVTPGAADSGSNQSGSTDGGTQTAPAAPDAGSSNQGSTDASSSNQGSTDTGSSNQGSTGSTDSGTSSGSVVVEEIITPDFPASTPVPTPAPTQTPSGGTGGNTSADNTASSTGTGSLTWPFPGHTNITSPFGYRASTGTNHTGIDIDGYKSKGSAIVAADGGTVIMARYNGGYGNCIMIDHGDKVTVYAHLDSMSVSVGSVVSKGQTIGGVGNTGTCYGLDGVHLHFEVRINSKAVDPMGYL